VQTYRPEHPSIASTWARQLVLSLSLLSPLGATAISQALGQERDGALAREGTAVVSSDPLDDLHTISTPFLSRSSAEARMRGADYPRYERARAEHAQIFGAKSSVLLIWPDHYLSYEPLGETTRFDDHGLKEHMHAWCREQLRSNHTSVPNFEDAVATVRATTSILGPAAFRIIDEQVEGPPLIAVVGFDSARPRALALKSLAGISCPTVMLTRLISREDLATFVRLHESGHAFQFLAGTNTNAEHESLYESCIIEAEADVFACLWWIKTHSGDTTVPTFFSHLRRSSYFEHAAGGTEKVSIQYATHLPFSAAIKFGELLVADGTLAAMTPEEIYSKARQIVALALPHEQEITDTTRILRTALHDSWQLPFHNRISQLSQMAQNDTVSPRIRSSLQLYLESVDFLTNPIHLRVAHPELAHFSLREQAKILWLRELTDDLRNATAPTLVLDRYTTELSAAALILWRLSTANSDPEAITKFIMHEGSPNAFFVPTETRSYYLDLAKKIAIETMNTPRALP